MARQTALRQPWRDAMGALVEAGRGGVRRRAGAAAFVTVALVTSFILAGCSFFPTPQLPTQQSTGGGTGGTGHSGSGSGDTSTPPATDTGTGTGLQQFAGLPPTFPKGAIPVIPGDIPVGIELGTGWTVIVKVTDTTTAFGEASNKLKAAGFTAQLESNSADGSFGDFSNDKYEVQVTGAKTADCGNCVTYLVVLKA